MRDNEYLETFVPIPGSTEEMEIRVYYNLGGMNYLNGQVAKRGLWLGMTPVRRGDGSITRTLMDDRGRKFQLEELPRKNTKKGEHWAAWVTKNLDVIATAAMEQDWVQIAVLHAAETQDA